DEEHSGASRLRVEDAFPSPTEAGDTHARSGMDPHFSITFPGEDRGGIMVRVVEADDGTLSLTEAQD
ncbi:hypothetical protein AB0F07_38435, partial [Streptomyces fructofermentans]